MKRTHDCRRRAPRSWLGRSSLPRAIPPGRGASHVRQHLRPQHGLRRRRACPRTGTSRPARTSSGGPTSARRPTRARCSWAARSSWARTTTACATPSSPRTAAWSWPSTPTNGEFLWQMTHEKLPAGRVNDWPQQGVCSTPYVEGNRLYYTSNRATIVSLDTEGFRDKENDGARRTRRSEPEIDGDVVWEFDMMQGAGRLPPQPGGQLPAGGGRRPLRHHRQRRRRGPHQHPLARRARASSPWTPKTGELRLGEQPARREDLPRHLVEPDLRGGQGPAAGHLPGRRRLDLQPRAQDGQAHLEVQRQPAGRQVRPGRPRHRQRDHRAPRWSGRTRSTSGVGQDPEHGEGVGNFWAIDATKDGDITGTGKVWHRGGNDFHRTISTVAIHDGIVYASDLSGFLYALDAKTGQHFWTHDMLAAVWGSPFVADGRVYLGDEDGDVEVLKAGKTKQVLGLATTWASPSTRRRWRRTASSTSSPATASSRCSRASPASRRRRGRRGRSRRSRGERMPMPAVATDLAVELLEDRPACSRAPPSPWRRAG